MTHSEFMHYIDSSGWREGDEYGKTRSNPSKLREIIENLSRVDDDDEDPDFDRLFEK
jgi:hypothetical protein